MPEAQGYRELLETSRRVNWRIEDVIGGGRLDFSRPFLPETFARTEQLAFLTPAERLSLNHVRARGYLAMFELVERFIAPFVVGQAAEREGEDPFRAAALQHFADEERKHMELFGRLLRELDAGLGVECGLIGPAEDIARAVLAHDSLSVAIAVLGLEWMSQGHYVESIKDDRGLDPQFKSLLRHHWIEEAQHAKLDDLMLRSLADRLGPDEIARAVEEYLGIVAFFDGGFRAQTELDLVAFERAASRTLGPDERAQFLTVQHQALRWTFLGSAMRNRSFLAGLRALGTGADARVEAAGAAYS